MKQNITRVLLFGLIISVFMISNASAYCSIVGDWSISHSNDPHTGITSFHADGTWSTSSSEPGGTYTVVDVINGIYQFEASGTWTFRISPDCLSFTATNPSQPTNTIFGKRLGSPQNCKVEMRTVQLEGVWFASHNRIVYTDEYGVKTNFEGGPSVINNTQCLNEGALWGDKEQGVHGKQLLGKINKFDSLQYYPPVAVVEGKDACGKDTCFANVATTINDNNFCYHVLGPNSNTVVYTMLDDCGLDKPNPYYSWGWQSIHNFDFSEIPPFIIMVLCPVDISAEDPSGMIITKQSANNPSASYIESDLDNDGDNDAGIIIRDPIKGNYKITVIPKPDAKPTDTFTLSIEIDGKSVILAQDVMVKDIPSTPYVYNYQSEDQYPVPEFPSTTLPVAMIIGFLGVVFYIRRTREH